MKNPDDFIPFEDDDIIDDANEHEGEDRHGGGRAERNRYNKTIDDTAPVPVKDTGELITLDDKKAEADEESDSCRVKPKPPQGETAPLVRKVDPAAAKRMIAEKLAAASVAFGSLPPEPKQPANDNYRGKESWPLLGQITRKTFEPDEFTRAKMIQAVHRIRHLVDTTGVDVIGLSVHLPGKESPIDFGMQHTSVGKTVYEHGQTLDRKERTYDAKNGEKEAVRHDGPVRTTQGWLVDKSGFDPTRDDPVAFRRIEASDELEEIIVAVGPPLWPYLMAAVCENRTFTEIGATTGAKGAQAPGVGSALVRIALLAAMAAIDRCCTEDRSGGKKPSKPAFGTPAPARRLKRALELAKFSAPKAA